MNINWHSAETRVPKLNFDNRQARSQSGLRSLYPNNNPITHNHIESSPNMRGSGNLWHHQKEQRDLNKQRQKMFLDALNEQRKVRKS